MRLMVWYLGFVLHIAALALRSASAVAWYFPLCVSLTVWVLFGLGLMVGSLARLVKQRGVPPLTPREVANLGKREVK